MHSSACPGGHSTEVSRVASHRKIGERRSLQVCYCVCVNQIPFLDVYAPLGLFIIDFQLSLADRRVSAHLVIVNCSSFKVL